MPPTTEPVVDLEAVRDEQVVPVARAVLSDMAADMASTDVNEGTDFTSLVIKVLQRGLDADLNVTTENPYIFQLILGQYSAFSSIVQKCKVADSEDERYGRIGREMMALLVSANIPMGTKIKPEEQEAAAAAIQPQLEELFARENLKWIEIKYILEGLFRSFKAIQQIYSVNIERSVKTMEAKILGIADMSDLSMRRLDEALKAEMAAVQ